MYHPGVSGRGRAGQCNVCSQSEVIKDKVWIGAATTEREIVSFEYLYVGYARLESVENRYAVDQSILT